MMMVLIILLIISYLSCLSVLSGSSSTTTVNFGRLSKDLSPRGRQRLALFATSSLPLVSAERVQLKQLLASNKSQQPIQFIPQQRQQALTVRNNVSNAAAAKRALKALLDALGIMSLDSLVPTQQEAEAELDLNVVQISKNNGGNFFGNESMRIQSRLVFIGLETVPPRSRTTTLTPKQPKSNTRIPRKTTVTKSTTRPTSSTTPATTPQTVTILTVAEDKNQPSTSTDEQLANVVEAMILPPLTTPTTTIAQEIELSVDVAGALDITSAPTLVGDADAAAQIALMMTFLNPDGDISDTTMPPPRVRPPQQTPYIPPVLMVVTKAPTPAKNISSDLVVPSSENKSPATTSNDQLCDPGFRPDALVVWQRRTFVVKRDRAWLIIDANGTIIDNRLFEGVPTERLWPGVVVSPDATLSIGGDGGGSSVLFFKKNFWYSYRTNMPTSRQGLITMTFRGIPPDLDAAFVRRKSIVFVKRHEFYEYGVGAELPFVRRRGNITDWGIPPNRLIDAAVTLSDGYAYLAVDMGVVYQLELDTLQIVSEFPAVALFGCVRFRDLTSGGLGSLAQIIATARQSSYTLGKFKSGA